MNNSENPIKPIKEGMELLQQRIVAFIRMESSGGIMLVAAMLAAMLMANSPLSKLYDALLTLVGEVRVGGFSIEKPVVIWINDLWMAVFFFLVGLEIKSELLGGHLSDRRQLLLPLLAAVGGMLVPAGIYVLLNYENPEGMYGWAIPMATDIAFALGVLSLIGDRVPVAARIFLMTLAIIDDLGAIIVIALFYTANLGLTSLALAGVMVAVLVVLNRLRVNNLPAYMLAGLLLWVFVLKSGVHATLAGVVTALCIPWQGLDDRDSETVNKLIELLHPWVAFAILPAFAFVNAGINFGSMNWADMFSNVPLGILLGLFAGKQLGIFGFSWLGIRSGLLQQPEGLNTLHLYGTSVLCGIGFTMSLFIGGLAFEGGGAYNGADRLAILVASIISAVLGYLVFLAASRLQPLHKQE